MNIDEYLIKEKVNWKKLRLNQIDLKPLVYTEIQDSILDYLKEKGSVTDFPSLTKAIILFRPDDWDINPFHYQEECHWYFTHNGIDEAENYIKDFLKKDGVRITKIAKIVG